MRYTLLSFIFISSILQTNAQLISGKIMDADAKPIMQASVSLLNASDSSLVKMEASESDGHFQFDHISNGNYLILATSVGYAQQYSPIFYFDSTRNENQSIILDKTNTQLTGIVVTAKRPPVEVKAGKTVVNVDASPTNAGLNVLEILEKSPGVSVDADGNVSVKGKGGVLILIDGKQTYLSGTQLAAFLKSIQASGLDQIEIMTNPPAKYDAAGGGGVINIKTKKGVVKGMNGNGSLTYIQGFYPKYMGGINLNYRNEKLNLFGSYDAGRWEGLGTLIIKRKFYDHGVFNSSSDQETNRHNISSWHNVKVGMDYNISQRDVAGIVVTGNINPWKQNQLSATNLRDGEGNLETILNSDADNANNSRNINTNLNYKHTFDSLGRELSVDLDQGYYNNKGNNFLTTVVADPNHKQIGNTVLLDGQFPAIIKIYSGKIDYVHPFNKEVKLETGIKSSFVNTDNNVIYKRDTTTGWYEDAARTNHFIYKENINAAYAIFTATIKKWELTAGLRVENTVAQGDQVKDDSSFKRNYTNLFPNAGLMYSINDKNQLSLSYSRRIRRPDYDDLNPFIFFLDSLTYGQGNPYLQPQFSNNIELSHTFNRFLTTTLNYTQTNDIITDILKQNTEKKTTFQTKENFSKMRQWGVTVNVNKQIVKWWNMNLFLNGMNNNYNGLYNDGKNNIPVKINLNALMTNMSNSFSFAKTWTAEVSGWYTTGFGEGLIIGRPMGSMNAAIAKKILKDNGTIKLGVRDIFRSNNFSGYSRYADVDIDLLNDRKLDNRQLNISFTYKFGNNKIAPSRRRTGSADDEQGRIKSSGN